MGAKGATGAMVAKRLNCWGRFIVATQVAGALSRRSRRPFRPARHLLPRTSPHTPADAVSRPPRRMPRPRLNGPRVARAVSRAARHRAGSAAPLEAPRHRRSPDRWVAPVASHGPSLRRRCAATPAGCVSARHRAFRSAQPDPTREAARPNEGKRHSGHRRGGRDESAWVCRGGNAAGARGLDDGIRGRCTHLAHPIE